jgi:hypothetical protein
MSRIPIAMAVVLLVTSPSGPVPAADFRGLGDLPGGMFWSAALGVSADGSVIVGSSYAGLPDGGSAPESTIGVLHLQDESGWWVAKKVPIANDSGGAGLGRTNYVGVAGLGGTSGRSTVGWQGIYYNRSQTTIAQITDGTSHTLMFGEALGGLQEDGGRPHSFSWMGCGAVPSMGGMDSKGVWSALAGRWYDFGSAHPDVVQFAYADGSVQAVPVQVDIYVFILLSGIADGELVDADFN